MKVRVENRANVNLLAEPHGTPLHLAACWRCVEFARYLVKNGADVNKLSAKKITPLEVRLVEGKCLASKRANATLSKAEEREEDNPFVEFLRSCGAKRYM